MSPPPGSLPAPAGHPRSRRSGDALAWLGGADREVLGLAQSGRSQFIQLGLVVLATAGLGVVSMSFALHTGVHVHPLPAVLGGLLWGCVIAVVDRFLITTLNLRAGVVQVVTIIAVRLAIAAVLGTVISTPLVLQVFQSEIQAQTLETNTEKNTNFGNALADTADAEELERLRTTIATHEGALRGAIPPVATPEVQARQDYLTTATATLAERQVVSDQKYRAWQCELYGSSCEESTSDPGNGTLAQAREREYRDALGQTNLAQRDVDRAAAALATAQDGAVDLGGDALQQAQDRANAELPGLRERRDALQAKVNAALDEGSQINRDNTGILAQLTALGALGEGNSEARLTHLLVGLLFFMIELLPVLVKILSSFGPATAYERVRDMLEEAKADNAKIEQKRRTRVRDEQERRMAEDDKNRNAIEDDMRGHERRLGIDANKRVAKEMEKVLDVALAQWAQQVQRTLHTTVSAAPSVNGVAPPGGSASSSNAPPPRTAAGPSSSTPQPTVPVQQTVLNKLNIPSGPLPQGPSTGGGP